MTNQFSRRRFLGGSALVAGATTASIIPMAASQAATTALKYGPAKGIAKLNANENPYGPSPDALKAMNAAASKGAYYVGESVPTLLPMIGERHGLKESQISLSSGSSGVLTYLAVAKAREGKILGPDLFWDTTTRAALRQGGEMKRIAKTADLAVDLDALYDAITPDVSMVQVCNPNNPTGMVVDAKKLKEFVIKASKKCTVLVDEAYNEITDDPESNSMIPLIKEGHDVFVARTFSKLYGLAGVVAAVATYNDTKFLSMSKQKIVEARGIILDAVKKNGLIAAPSETSFVFVDLGNLNAEAFRGEMAKQNVLIRGIYQDYTNWSRVSCGRIDDVKQYAAAMPIALEKIGA